MSSLSIGFVGAGFNTNFHLQALTEVRDCHVGGVASRTMASAENSAELARSLGLGNARAFESVEALAADPSIDAIWVNSPNDSRVVVFEAIARGNAKRKTKLRGVACCTLKGRPATGSAAGERRTKPIGAPPPNRGYWS